MIINDIIDLHIPASPDWPRHLLERAIASTKGEPVNVRVVPYTGSLGASRAHGYHHGTAPYVAFLDADDELIPGGLAALAAILDADPSLCGAYGAEERIWPDGRTEQRSDQRWTPIAQLTRSSAMHGAILMRRSAVMPHLAETAKLPVRSNRLLRGLVTQHGPWQACQVPSYRWHLRDGSLRTQPAPGIDTAITRRLTPILMAAHKRQNTH
jgi:glycosyltransferase involved in cell wall biosynthesis